MLALVSEAYLRMLGPGAYAAMVLNSKLDLYKFGLTTQMWVNLTLMIAVDSAICLPILWGGYSLWMWFWQRRPR